MSAGRKAVGMNRIDQGDNVNNMACVNSPLSATGVTRDGNGASRILPTEGGRFRAFGPQPRSENAGGTDRSPEGDPPRRRGQTRESGDAGRRATPGRKPVVVAAENRKHPRQPDEGLPEFTMVPEVESLTRGFDMSSPTSARRESADYDASLSTMPTSGADYQTRYAETQINLSNLTNTKQSIPGPFQAARAGITQTKDRQIDLGVDSAVQSHTFSQE